MEMELTVTQWSHLQILVSHGSAVARALTKPIEVSNSNAKIEIDDNAIRILLPDE